MGDARSHYFDMSTSACTLSGPASGVDQIGTLGCCKADVYSR